jgi:ubiquinone biosynthesis protein UbiJ
LIWSFRKSRDRWKQKHRALKADLKRHRNHVADATRARDAWRARAAAADARAEALAAEVDALRARIDALEAGKKSPPPRSR